LFHGLLSPLMRSARTGLRSALPSSFLLDGPLGLMKSSSPSPSELFTPTGRFHQLIYGFRHERPVPPPYCWFESSFSPPHPTPISFLNFRPGLALIDRRWSRGISVRRMAVIFLSFCFLKSPPVFFTVFPFLTHCVWNWFIPPRLVFADKDSVSTFLFFPPFAFPFFLVLDLTALSWLPSDVALFWRRPKQMSFAAPPSRPVFFLCVRPVFLCWSLAVFALSVWPFFCPPSRSVLETHLAAEISVPFGHT